MLFQKTKAYLLSLVNYVYFCLCMCHGRFKGFIEKMFFMQPEWSPTPKRLIIGAHGPLRFLSFAK